MEDGYKLPVYGLDDDTFYSIHVSALVCILLSLITAAVVIFLSFYGNRPQVSDRKVKSFFSWSKSERFVVYMAVCDGLFNVFHSADHIQILATKDHVRPRGLCRFYGFVLVEFVFAQTLMINVVAINAFALICWKQNFDLGKWDWKLLSWTFGVPFALAVCLVATNQLGPTGHSCFFDGVTAKKTAFYLVTLPLLVILIANFGMYMFTWFKIRKESNEIKETLGNAASTLSASYRAARNMSLFIMAFLIQWWACALYGIWLFIGEVPQPMFQCVTTFTNLGGVLNGIVYFTIRRRKRTTVPLDIVSTRTSRI